MYHSEELWTPLPGFENLFEISTYGRIKSKPRFSSFKTYFKRPVIGKVLKTSTDKYNYSTVSIRKDGIKSTFFIHRLVAQTFIPNPNNFPQVNHIDHNPQNNNISNLEWCTPLENVHHALKANRWNAQSGEKCGKSKLKESEVLFIRQNYFDFSVEQLSKLFNVHKGTIKCIIDRKTWKHV